MSEPKPCCRTLPNSARSPTPFVAGIALDYYDGFTGGLLQCGHCGREFRFKWLDVCEGSSGDDEVRIFGLADVPHGSIASIEEERGTLDERRGPVWFLHWSFPTEEARERMDALIERIYARTSTEGLVLASKEGPTGEILVSRSLPPDELTDGRDWFAFLGVVREDPS
jgi:hypothetical protein